MQVDIVSLRIVCYPDPVLRKAAQPIAEVTTTVREVAQRMLQLMHEAKGVGLAGPQVGLGYRLFVANPTQEPDGDRVFINPILTNPTRKSAQFEEGCLSLPQVTGQITRTVGITIEALDLDAKPFTLISEKLAARIWQHEIDHLNGILILDRMSPIDKIANRQAIKELESA